MELILALILPQALNIPSGPERLVGLITLPQVLGAGACVPFEPRSIALFARPRALVPIAQVQVDKYWTLHPAGGCDELEVRIYETGRPAVPLPTAEFDYEMPAAIVVGRDGEWFQIRMPGRALWLRGTSDNVFLPFAELLTSDRLTHLTAFWDGSMYATPGGTRLGGRSVSPESTVRVMRAERRSGDLWLLVETTEGCNPDEPKVAAVRGWVRAYAKVGQPAVWFSSRGC